MKTLTRKTSLMTSGLIAIFLTSSATLSGCAGASKEQTSTIVGSVIGGAAGYQFGKGKGKRVATVLGAIAGGMIGGNVGRGLDQQDQQRVNQTMENCLNVTKKSLGQTQIPKLTMNLHRSLKNIRVR